MLMTAPPREARRHDGGWIEDDASSEARGDLLPADKT
jgi:hypothetical protein